MPKEKTHFLCQSCGYISPRWMGKCPECNAWNSFTEEKLQISPKRKSKAVAGTPVAVTKIEEGKEQRIRVGIGELRRVLGGGIVYGSAILIGGEPGIGKSTLLMQALDDICRGGYKSLYVSGEESARQIKLRADRLAVASENLGILTETDMGTIIATIREYKPQVVVIDSIQTTQTPNSLSPPGSVGQIRECAYELIDFAKKEGVALFLVGHVTKEGVIAGPKVLEHMVDTVLYFEGDKDHLYRIVRAVKNRFGPSGEVGIFEMTESGLQEVKDPSRIFLSERERTTSGSVTTCAVEGTRPLLLEIQALVTNTSYGIPQRVSTGIDTRRVALLLAILEKREGLGVKNFDVFVNVAGGVKIVEPASDLAVAIAVASNLWDKPFDAKSIAVGEVGLGGEVRSVSRIEERIKEAEKLGFEEIVLPKSNLTGREKKFKIRLTPVSSLSEALERLR
jgi:DNA repair protein RadA/Sms